MSSLKWMLFLLLCSTLKFNLVKSASIQYEVVDTYLRITSTLVETKSMNEFTKNVLKVSKLFGQVVGGVLSIVDSIMAEMEQERRHQELLNELRLIDDKLNVLSDNIKRRFDEVDLAISFDQIANQVTELNAVEDEYQEWLMYGNNLTTTRTNGFRAACISHKISRKPGFFRGLFTRNDQIRKTRDLLIGSRSRTKYFKFASSMVGYYLYSVVLSGVCTGLQGNTTDVQITIQQNALIYEKYLNEMSSVIESEYDQLTRNFWKNAIKDMDEFTEKFKGSSHSTFAHEFHRRLTETYDFREWFVVSYGDQNTIGPKMHEVDPPLGEQIYNNAVRSTYFYNAVRKHGRNLIMASPSSIESVSYSRFAFGARKCIENSGLSTAMPNGDSREIVKRLKSCSFNDSLIGFNWDIRLKPHISFAFMDHNWDYEVVDNSWLAMAQRKKFFVQNCQYCVPEYFVLILIV